MDVEQKEQDEFRRVREAKRQMGMTLEEKWKEEARSYIKNTFTSGYDFGEPYIQGFIDGYLAACQKRQEEKVKALNSLLDFLPPDWPMPLE